MDVDAALVPQGDSLAVADSSISAVDDLPPLPSQVHLPPEIAEPTPAAVHYHSNDDVDTEHAAADGTAADITSDAVEPPSSVTPIKPDPSPACQFPVRHLYDRDSRDTHRYHLPISAISPHKPLKSDIEEDALLWLRLTCLDSCLRWEDGDVPTFRSASALRPDVFRRPAGQFTWTLRAAVSHIMMTLYGHIFHLL